PGPGEYRRHCRPPEYASRPRVVPPNGDGAQSAGGGLAAPRHEFRPPPPTSRRQRRQPSAWPCVSTWCWWGWARRRPTIAPGWPTGRAPLSPAARLPHPGAADGPLPAKTTPAEPPNLLFEN